MTAEVHVLRHAKPEQPFTFIYNVVVDNEALSYRALGLLVALLRKPEGWRFRMEDMAKGEGREGRDAVIAASRELIAAGHYRVERRQGEGGRWTSVAMVSPLPVPGWLDPATSTETGFPGVGQPGPGFPGVGGPGLFPKTVPKTEIREGAAAQPALIDEPAVKQPRRSAERHEVPADWHPDDAGILYARDRGLSGRAMVAEVEKFRDHHRARGDRFKRIELAWQKWVRNWAAWNTGRSAPPGAPRRDPNAWMRGEGLTPK